jgi:glutathione peroxidase-family protein
LPESARDIAEWNFAKFLLRADGGRKQ